jgi:hypothetical protein
MHTLTAPSKAFDRVVFAEKFGKPTPMHQAYNFTTTTGPYHNLVDVFFDVNDNGDVYDMEVMFHEVNIYNVISEGQTEVLASEAWRHYIAACSEQNDDLRIAAWESSK